MNPDELPDDERLDSLNETYEALAPVPRRASMTPDQIIERRLSDLALRSARTALLVHFGDLYRPDKIGRDAFGRSPFDSPSQT